MSDPKSGVIRCMRVTVITLNGLFIIGAIIAFFIGIHAMLAAREQEFFREVAATKAIPGHRPPKLTTIAPEDGDNMISPDDMSGETLIIFALITIAVALLGLFGAIRRSFSLLFTFTIIILISLLLRVIFLLTIDTTIGPPTAAVDNQLPGPKPKDIATPPSPTLYPGEPIDPHAFESRIIGIVFACIELLMAVFSLRLAFEAKRREISNRRAGRTVNGAVGRLGRIGDVKNHTTFGTTGCQDGQLATINEVTTISSEHAKSHISVSMDSGVDGHDRTITVARHSLATLLAASPTADTILEDSPIDEPETELTASDLINEDAV